MSRKNYEVVVQIKEDETIVDELVLTVNAKRVEDISRAIEDAFIEDNILGGYSI